MTEANNDGMEDLRAYKSIVARYFHELDLLPILISANQRVGDVYDVANKWAFLSSGAECFPGLGEIPESKSNLPEAIEIKRTQVGAAVGLAKLLLLKGSLDHSTSVKLKFTDATVQRVSQMALRRALCPDCAHLRPIVEQMEKSDKSGVLPIVVGTVLSARREVFVGSASGRRAEMSANLSQIVTGLPLEVLNLDPSASAAMGYGDSWGCLLRSKARIPVALGPAFFPQVLYDTTQGSGSTWVAGIMWRAVEGNAARDWLIEAAESLPMPSLD
jgi:hypothetical protein